MREMKAAPEAGQDEDKNAIPSVEDTAAQPEVRRWVRLQHAQQRQGVDQHQPAEGVREPVRHGRNVRRDPVGRVTMRYRSLLGALIVVVGSAAVEAPAGRLNRVTSRAADPTHFPTA